LKDFSVNEDLMPPFIPVGNFMSKIRIGRVMDGAEKTVASFTLFLDISGSKDRRNVKLF
jgi:hypothetical protein